MAVAQVMVIDLMRLFDEDATSELLIDDMEFHKAMSRVFRCKAKPWVIDEVFASIDIDGASGVRMSI